MLLSLQGRVRSALGPPCDVEVSASCSTLCFDSYTSLTFATHQQTTLLIATDGAPARTLSSRAQADPLPSPPLDNKRASRAVCRRRSRPLFRPCRQYGRSGTHFRSHAQHRTSCCPAPKHETRALTLRRNHALPARLVLPSHLQRPYPLTS